MSVRPNEMLKRPQKASVAVILTQRNRPVNENLNYHGARMRNPT